MHVSGIEPGTFRFEVRSLNHSAIWVLTYELVVICTDMIHEGGIWRSLINFCSSMIYCEFSKSVFWSYVNFKNFKFQNFKISKVWKNFTNFQKNSNFQKKTIQKKSKNIFKNFFKKNSKKIKKIKNFKTKNKIFQKFLKIFKFLILKKISLL